MRKSICLILVLALASCSVKKRSYRSGFYIDWAFAKNKISPEKKSDKNVVRAVNASSPVEIQKAEILYASAENNAMPAKADILPAIKTEDCNDSVFFRKGDVVRAKVFEINEKQIKYKRCDNFDGPSIIVNKNDVDRVRYSNGMTEKFEIVHQEIAQPSQPVKKEIPKSEKVMHPLAVAAFVAACASFIAIFFPTPIIYLVTAVLGAVFTPIARRKIRENPDKYKGMGLVKAARIIGWVILGIFLLVLIIALALM